ncbi:GNAT family N-acetyltransferase [Streptacidiphilus cavernicola]|uniref:GNAT family N-acetyltransferase n=1 Tax=Streptacidiphilus cavernicola TaxID=3342716 RepID=A0ABV6W626_9ACTN
MNDVTIEPFDLAGRAAEALAVQAAAFGLSREEVAVRLQIVGRHAQAPGVRAFGAVERSHPGAYGRLVGFGYGMPNDRSHWWSSVIEPHLEANGNGAWLDRSFSVTELHVHPEYQGRGLGRLLITTLCGATGLPRTILSAIDRDTPARVLYRSLGYRDLANQVMFPNTTVPYAVMGAVLPFSGRS